MLPADIFNYNAGHPFDQGDAEQVMANYNAEGPNNLPHDENVERGWGLGDYLSHGYSMVKNPLRSATSYIMRRGIYAGLQGAWNYAFGLGNKPPKHINSQSKNGMSRGGYSITRHFCTF